MTVPRRRRQICLYIFVRRIIVYCTFKLKKLAYLLNNKYVRFSILIKASKNKSLRIFKYTTVAI